MRQAELILEHYENRIKEVESGCECSPTLRDAVSRYKALWESLMLPQVYSMLMGWEPWQPIDDALGAVWDAIDREDAGHERRGLRDDLREIKQLAERLVDHNTSASTQENVSAEATGFHHIDFPSDGTRVVFKGESYQLDERQVAILKILVEADGDWRSGPEMEEANRVLRDERIDRQIKALPPPLVDLVERLKGKGYRLTFPKMA